MKFLNLQEHLIKRDQQGLTRQRRVIDSVKPARIISDNKNLINFASNDYLGLSQTEGAILASQQTAESYGVGSTASHLICGHQRPHEQLDIALAKFVERDSAVTFSSGYMANLAILQTLTKKGDLVVADKLNHASLIDGVRLSGADSKRYAHCDLIALETRLKASKQNTFVVTDSVFSMDGDIAPLKQIAELCKKYNAILIVDDAHGFGCLGESGQGCAQHFGLDQKQLPVVMSTLGKALGGYGAFVSGEKQLIDYLIQFARPYIYTTAMPAMVAAANLANLNKLKSTPELLRKLKHNIQYFKLQCLLNEVDLVSSDTSIQPLIIGENQKLMHLNEALLRAGFLVGAIRPPTVPEGSARLRITLSAAHTEKQIEKLVQQLSKLMAI